MNVNFLKWKSENWKNDTKFCVFSSFHFHIRLSQMNLNIFDFHSRPAVAHILLPFVSRLSASAGCEVNVLPPTQLNGPDSKRLHLPPIEWQPSVLRRILSWQRISGCWWQGVGGYLFDRIVSQLARQISEPNEWPTDQLNQSGSRICSKKAISFFSLDNHRPHISLWCGKIKKYKKG